MFLVAINYLLKSASRKVLKVLNASIKVKIIKTIAIVSNIYAINLESSILFRALKAIFSVIGDAISKNINTNNFFNALLSKSVLTLIFKI